MHLARRMTVKSYTQIGQFFNRDHSTVMHAYEEIRRLRRVDPELNDGVRAVVEALK